jgi:4-amino-4-deoxy-L-arabinose transferase-like glycosyltransferase
MRGGGVRQASCLLAIAAFLVACLVIAARCDLWAPYEPDLVETAREMRARGDWIEPHLNGALYLEKPPLFYWAVLTVSWIAGGLTEFTARVPSIVAAAAALAALEHLARRLFPQVPRWSAAAICATTVVFFFCAFRGMTDALLGATTLVSLVLFHRDVWGARADGRPATALGAATAWIALALAFLAKGPVAVVFVGLTIVPEMFFSRRIGAWAAAWRRQVPGLACFAVLVVPWYAIGFLRHGAPFLDEALLRQNVGRFFDSADGGGPFFMAWNLPPQMGLWGLLLPAVAWFAWKSAAWRRTGEFDPVRFLATGALLELAFLSVCGAKLPKYVLVLTPHVSILAAELVRRLGRGTAPSAMGGAGFALGAAAGLLAAAGAAALAAPLLADRFGERVRAIDLLGIQIAGAVLVLGGAAGCVAAVRREWQTVAPALSLALALACVAVATTPTLASVNATKTTRPFAERAAAHLDDGTPLLGCCVSDCESMFLFYARRPYETLARPADVVERLKRDGRVLVLAQPPFLEELPEKDAANFRVLERQEPGKRDYLLVEGTRRPGGL